MKDLTNGCYNVNAIRYLAKCSHCCSKAVGRPEVFHLSYRLGYVQFKCPRCGSQAEVRINSLTRTEIVNEISYAYPK